MRNEWQHLGPVAKYDQLAAIYQAICGRLIWFWLPTSQGPTRARTKLMGGPSHLFGFDYNFKRYIEQNPSLPSDFSRRVREKGIRIVWVINTQTKEYIGRIEDGIVWIKKR